MYHYLSKLGLYILELCIKTVLVAPKCSGLFILSNMSFTAQPADKTEATNHGCAKKCTTIGQVVQLTARRLHARAVVLPLDMLFVNFIVRVAIGEPCGIV